MFVHLTATLTGGADRAIIMEAHPSSLLSFAYAETERTWKGVWDGLRAQQVTPRLILDSGAFTAHTLGKTFTPDAYAQWVHAMRARWTDKMAAVHCMNLDVIGDQHATWRNQRTLEAFDIDPMPIITFDAPMKDLRQALEQYDYIAFGGLVPHARNRKRLQGWLDTCFREVLAHRERTGTLRRIHLLGITSEWALMRYPLYSSDSSSFIACIRYGRGHVAELPSIPRYSQGKPQAAAAQYALRMEVRKLAQLEQQATALWAKRGIAWT